MMTAKESCLALITDWWACFNSPLVLPRWSSGNSVVQPPKCRKSFFLKKYKTLSSLAMLSRSTTTSILQFQGWIYILFDLWMSYFNASLYWLGLSFPYIEQERWKAHLQQELLLIRTVNSWLLTTQIPLTIYSFGISQMIPWNL